MVRIQGGGGVAAPLDPGARLTGPGGATDERPSRVVRVFWFRHNGAPETLRRGGIRWDYGVMLVTVVLQFAQLRGARARARMAVAVGSFNRGVTWMTAAVVAVPGEPLDSSVQAADYGNCRQSRPIMPLCRGRGSWARVGRTPVALNKETIWRRLSSAT